MAREEQTVEASGREEITVFSIRRESQCAECGRELGPGNLLRVEREQALCLECADLGHLEFLPTGDAAVTRRATKYSRLRAIVLRWSQTRKRYERQGILVEPEAICRVEEEPLADVELRTRRHQRAAEQREIEDRACIERFAAAIREQYPGCPQGEESRIAEHACRKYSGRIGRSSAAKELDPEAIRLAVAAQTHFSFNSFSI